ncbi:MAG: EAL domain-containing response regulator [Actinomycetia bacterium]|nr:EAL domain-containing response regulator [Actinomycetes bacterium]
MGRTQVPRVLIVDDDSIMADLAAAVLRGIGVRDVVHAIDGAAALVLLESDTSFPDLIMCDINMPTMDGLSLMRELEQLRFGGMFAVFSGESEAMRNVAAQLAQQHDLAYAGMVSKPFTPAGARDLLARYRAYEPTVHAPRRSASRISVADLSEGIATDQLFVLYQPQVMATKPQVVTGFEALVRWGHPTYGVVPPEDFIGVAEECGLIEGLTASVVGHVLGDYPKLAAATGSDGLRVSVNISVSSLRELDLPGRMAALVAAADIEPSRIVLEVTESLGLSTTDSLEVLARLRMAGFELSIDDFGTGYSSLRQLQAAPFSELKIDRQFICSAVDDRAALAVVETSAELARKVGLRSVAEGVETREEWAIALNCGVDVVQGFILSRPLTLDAALAFLRRAGSNPSPVDEGSR